MGPMMLDSLHALLWAAALTALAASAWTDLKLRIIPNALSGVVAASGLGLSLMLRPEGTWIGLLAATFTLFGLGVFAHYGVMGGGDVKMIGAATLLVPPALIGQLFACIALAGGLLACAYLVARRALRSGHSEQLPASAEAGGGAGAFSSKVETGSRRENATKQTARAPFQYNRNGKGSSGLIASECARIVAGGSLPYALAILGGVAGVTAGELSRCLYASFCSF
jgi:prepilin peptidase CpaA